MAIPRVDVRQAEIGELLESLLVLGRNLERQARFIRQVARAVEARLDADLEREAGVSAGDTIGHPGGKPNHGHDHARHPVAL